MRLGPTNVEQRIHILTFQI